MADHTATFDAAAFYEALDAQRRAKQVTWRQVAGSTGISASTFTRMAQGRRPDVDSLASLCSWSGLRADNFVRGENREPEPEPLAMISTLLRGDRNLTPTSAAMLNEMIKATYERLRKA